MCLKISVGRQGTVAGIEALCSKGPSIIIKVTMIFPIAGSRVCFQASNEEDVLSPYCHVLCISCSFVPPRACFHHAVAITVFN